MGRWFGFRHGYEDLPTLVATRPRSLVSNFRALAHIGKKFREDILDLSGQQGHTSGVCGARVRSIPGLAITFAREVLHHAYRTSISYEGWHIQNNTGSTTAIRLSCPETGRVHHAL